jgi:hypothetical protein
VLEGAGWSLLLAVTLIILIGAVLLVMLLT